jgi:hypothetical protein
MNYFTPELVLRGNSADAAVVEGVEQDWERAIQSYRRRLAKIKAAFPEGWQRFRKDRVRLHDAQLLSMARQGSTLVFVLQQEPPLHNIVVLIFTLDSEPEIDPTALPGRQHRTFITWMYEEFDVDRHGKCCFEVLLSNGWAEKLRFRDFSYLMGRAILPIQNGQAAQAPGSQLTCQR